MPAIHFKQPGFILVLVDHLIKTKKELKNLKKQEILDISTKMNLIRHAFNMIRVMAILKV